MKFNFVKNTHTLYLAKLSHFIYILQGLFNSIAYGLNSSVRRAICERLDK